MIVLLVSVLLMELLLVLVVEGLGMVAWALQQEGEEEGEAE